jgi:hypothetical protein
MGEPDRNVGVNELRAVCDLSSLGLAPTEVTRVTLIHRKHGDRLYRVEGGARSYVLEWFHDPAGATEVSFARSSEVQPIPMPTDRCLLTMAVRLQSAQPASCFASPPTRSQP